MAEADGQLIQTTLKGIQERLSSIEAKLTEHDGRFDRIDRRLEDVEVELTHALGLSTASLARVRSFTDKHGDVTARLEELAARVAVLEGSR